MRTNRVLVVLSVCSLALNRDHHWFYSCSSLYYHEWVCRAEASKLPPAKSCQYSVFSKYCTIRCFFWNCVFLHWASIFIFVTFSLYLRVFFRWRPQTRICASWPRTTWCLSCRRTASSWTMTARGRWSPCCCDSWLIQTEKYRISLLNGQIRSLSTRVIIVVFIALLLVLWWFDHIHSLCNNISIIFFKYMMFQISLLSGVFQIDYQISNMIFAEEFSSTDWSFSDRLFIIECGF